MNEAEKRIWGLMMVGFEGTTVPPHLRELMGRVNLGGVILFSRNITDVEQLRRLCFELQEAHADPLPLLIAMDQEGGAVLRLTRGATVFPGNMALGATRSTELAEKFGEACARELRSLGINVNLAPVLDVNSNPHNPGIGVRSFGDEPGLVAELGAAVIRGMQRNGILATAKHFPGKGEAVVDSHLELPVVDVDKAHLRSVELPPFVRAIEEGIHLVMTSHAVYPALDDTPRMSGTFSFPILTSLLRTELGFEGVVIIDDLEMGAITTNCGVGAAAAKAVAAGADLVLVCHQFERQHEAVRAISKKIEDGAMPLERVTQSLDRVTALKQWVKRQGTSPPIQTEAHAALAQEIAEHAVTLVSNRDGFLPLRLRGQEKIAVTTPVLENLVLVEDASEGSDVFTEELMNRWSRVVCATYSPKAPTPDELNAAREAIRSSDLAIVASYNAHLFPAQQELLRSLFSLGKPTVLVALRDPYDLALFAEPQAKVTAYGFRWCHARAVLDLVFGKIQPKGTLPVKLTIEKR